MRQYDVLVMPFSGRRVERPYVIVLQHQRVSFAQTVVVAPLTRLSASATNARLSPRLPVLGESLWLLTPELAPIPTSRLRGPALDNLEDHSFEITSALDHLFSAAG